MDKIRENRLRKAAARQGYRLVKCHRRDPRAQGYGQYMITDPNTAWVVAGGHPGFDLTLDDVESWLTR